ncbi:hypothetical protein J2T41_006000 [Pseudomonas citronellolis]|uniref:hypothetical protein n=1 Tax=Pseudomonas citronellolis TaxID=53408 RepID=UPI00209F90C3|nr:hypothetical protein [Pseudomonas citronellolis]MCP1646344.1 hypothetical protein [Pseudomonas citronellolis]MCP1669291.1 hypothetical protein [Pseudomonas citronellolis]MCP1700971.1 hypothetical protein [Pseudomonas citronellolis]MCP1707214.1 hypothetical protein [Pseudomonas citronellolis]MCP1800985.1 hypothetical protein [Pseudomonas citronellolis]
MCTRIFFAGATGAVGKRLLPILLALEWGAPGCYNLAEQDTEVNTVLARHRLGWQPGFRLARGETP